MEGIPGRNRKSAKINLTLPQELTLSSSGPPQGATRIPGPAGFLSAWWQAGEACCRLPAQQLPWQLTQRQAWQPVSSRGQPHGWRAVFLPLSDWRIIPEDETRVGIKGAGSSKIMICQRRKNLAGQDNLTPFPKVAC